jgi:EAL domain-containing protein (putative c-di-GMP-specific phosphodiesterase class I)
MGAQVIGEGLDTLEELEMLGRLGIRFGQGWLFGHPTPLLAKGDQPVASGARRASGIDVTGIRKL